MAGFVVLGWVSFMALAVVRDWVRHGFDGNGDYNG